MMYNVLDINNGDESDKDTTIITLPAITATTAGSTIGSTYATNNSSMVSPEVTAAINQLAANQTAMYQQMVTMSFSPPPTACCTPTPPKFHVPPIQNPTIPMHQTFAGGGYNQGMVYQQNGGGWHGGGRWGCTGRGGRGCTLFTNHMAGARSGLAASSPGQGISQMGGFPQIMIPGALSPAQQSTQCANPPPPNIYKHHNNWSACFSYRVDEEDGHTSQTCQAHWRKANHQESYVCKNAQQVIDVRYNPCTKGMHKSVLPTRQYNWRCGAENVVANKCKK